MPALAYVGFASGTGTGGSTTIASASRSFTTGNHIVVWVRWENSNPATITVADTAGNTYTALTKTYETIVGGRWFYCLNATGHATNVVTATFSALQGFRDIYAVEFSGDAASVSEVVGSGHESLWGINKLSTAPFGSLAYGSNSVVLGGWSSSGSDSGVTFSGLPGRTFSKLTQASVYSAVAYSIETVGYSGAYVSGSGNYSTKIIHGIAIASGNTPPAEVTEFQVSQIPVEVLRTNDAVEAQASQVVGEVLRTNNAVEAQASQIVVEVLRVNPDYARLTQQGVETVASYTPEARLTQQGVETISSYTPTARMTQVGVEVIRSVGVGFCANPSQGENLFLQSVFPGSGSSPPDEWELDGTGSFLLVSQDPTHPFGTSGVVSITKDSA